MVPFTFPPTLNASAQNPQANALARAHFHAPFDEQERQRNKRGTFWTILLQIELEEVNLEAVANRGL